MSKNPILDELRRTRETLLAEAGGSLEGLVAQLQQDERVSEREFVRPKEPAGQNTAATRSRVEADKSQSSPASDR